MSKKKWPEIKTFTIYELFDAVKSMDPTPENQIINTGEFCKINLGYVQRDEFHKAITKIDPSFNIKENKLNNILAYSFANVLYNLYQNELQQIDNFYK